LTKIKPINKKCSSFRGSAIFNLTLEAYHSCHSIVFMDKRGINLITKFLCLNNKL
jgi:hypothetical protein